MKKIIPYSVANGLFTAPKVPSDKHTQAKGIEPDKQGEFSSLLSLFLGKTEKNLDVLLTEDEEEQETEKNDFVPSELVSAMSVIYPDLVEQNGEKANSDSFIQIETSLKVSESLKRLTDTEISVLQKLSDKYENIDHTVLPELLSKGEKVDDGVLQKFLEELIELPIESELVTTEDVEVINSLLARLAEQDLEVTTESDTIETSQWEFSEEISDQTVQTQWQTPLRQLSKTSNRQTPEQIDTTMDLEGLPEDSLITAEDGSELNVIDEESLDLNFVQANKVTDPKPEMESTVLDDTNYSVLDEVSADEDLSIQTDDQMAISDKKSNELPNRRWNPTREVAPSKEDKLNFDLANLRAVSNEFRTEQFSSELVEEENLRSEIMHLQENEAIPKLAENIQTLIREERSEVRIQLKPDHLGDMRIKLSLEKGIMIAEFIVENEAVKEVIASQLPQLHTALQDQGAQIGEMMVNIGFQNQQEREETPSRMTQSRPQARMQTSSTVNQKETTAYLGRTAWNQVDLKV